jgi:hypothetical protein
VVPFDLAMRPAQAALPASLREQLLLGRALIRYHGLMTYDEGQALAWLYAGAASADARAIQRLYRATLAKVARASRLYLRTRRANAAPSSLRLLDIELLVPSAKL